MDTPQKVIGYIGDMGRVQEHARGSFIHHNKNNCTQHTTGVSNIIDNIQQRHKSNDLL